MIPTLNAAGSLARTLETLLAAKLDMEIIIIDGGSKDGTVRVAEAFGVRILTGPRGRGHQLRAGGAAAKGSWLFFLHADSFPQIGWQAVVTAFMKDEANTYRAGYFQFLLDDTNRRARRVEGLANWRARSLSLPYGDQGLLISRAFYDHIGGFAEIPLMEDVTIVRRIGGKRLIQLDCAMVTSAWRYQADGYWGRPLRNVICLGLYYLGVSPQAICRFYKWRGF